MESTSNTTDKKIQMAFAATDKAIEYTIPSGEESETRGKEYISWGKDNQYPEYLHGLYDSVSSLRTIIQGIGDYVAGDDAVCNVAGFEKEMNSKGDTLREIITYCARDYGTYGGYALLVIRDRAKRIKEIYYLDFRYLRSSKKNDVFWYSEEYGKKYSRSSKTIVYPKFMAESDAPASILYVKNEKSQTYPSPVYKAAVKDCEIERQIDEYHLSALENGFGGSYIINFGNGIPTDAEKAEIEKNIQEKFAGASNAGRMLLNFSNGRDNGVTMQKLEIQDFSEKYQAAADRSREQIYASFRATPALFGIATAEKGFSEEEYEQVFRLFNRTMIKPIQRSLGDTFDKIFSTKDSISIKPFSIDENKTTETTVN